MVVDRFAEPMNRIWCLYEISRAEELTKQCRSTVDGRELSNATKGTLDTITAALVKVRASKSDATSQEDRMKVLFHILDGVQIRSFRSLEQLR